MKKANGGTGDTHVMGVGSTSEAVRSCTQVSLGACRLAQLLGVLQSGGAEALSAGSLKEQNNNNQ